MELKLYDTLTRDKRPFQPLDPANVRMYVCGPTVYDYAHIGNARPVIVFDVLFRLLRHLYGVDHVTYARNITDVDDKINARAAAEYPELPLNEAISRVTTQTEAQFHADVAALGCLPPTIEPRATEHIDEMKALIERLIAAGCAYVAEDHVLFHVAAMPDYGALSKRSLDEMIAGARVEVAPYKREPTDFVLWKPSKPGEPAWPSPAGIEAHGRPGWHIECSAMSWKHLGETFDIHGGGIDLVFPHHENEIAQSRCAFHTPFMARTWMHNGFLQVEGEKMAKSVGNFVTINELLTGWKGRAWPGNAIRLSMLSTHYRQPLNWTEERLEQTEFELFQFGSGMHGLIANRFDNDFTKFDEFLKQASRAIPADFMKALTDDLNTPAALACIRQRYSKMNADENVAVEVLNALEFLGVVDRDQMLLNQRPMVHALLGGAEEIHRLFDIGQELTVARRNSNAAEVARIIQLLKRQSIEVREYPYGLLSMQQSSDLQEKHRQVQALVDARDAARMAKDFKEADRIRDELAAMGIVLKDSKDGTTWEVAR